LTKKINKIPDHYSQESSRVIKAQKKNQYALRAIFELARHWEKGPIKIAHIARAQAIPVRFLEVILGHLKGSGLVKAKRGYYGGYLLTRHPSEITVGSIFRYMSRPITPDRCIVCVSGPNCSLHGNCAFASMWNRVYEAVCQIYDETTIEDLIEEEKQHVLHPSMIL
jgi:Rrf2 family protein